jgi:2-keto-4-pentenoate hydratase
MSRTDHPSIPGQDIMLERRRAQLRVGARRVGWKIGRDIAEARHLLGDRPVLGALTSATVLPDTGIYAAAHPVALRAETELLLQIGNDVAVTSEPDDIRTAIAGIGVALELVDVGRPPGDLETIVADNVFHRAVVVGDARHPLAAANADAILTVNGRPYGADRKLPDLLAAVRDAAALLALSGERLMAGDLLLTGSLVHVPVGPGDHLVAEIAGLGQVTASIDR